MYNELVIIFLVGGGLISLALSLSFFKYFNYFYSFTYLKFKYYE